MGEILVVPEWALENIEGKEIKSITHSKRWQSMSNVQLLALKPSCESWGMQRNGNAESRDFPVNANIWAYF